MIYNIQKYIDQEKTYNVLELGTVKVGLNINTQL